VSGTLKRISQAFTGRARTHKGGDDRRATETADRRAGVSFLL